MPGGTPAPDDLPACRYQPVVPLQSPVPGCSSSSSSLSCSPSSSAGLQLLHSPTSAMGQLVNDGPLQLRKSRRSLSKSSYKHIPHRDKPPQLVARRNARERRRVQAVNNAFSRLRRHVPYENRHKRLSKVKTLRIAIDYINYLQRLIHDFDSQRMGSRGHGGCALEPSNMTGPGGLGQPGHLHVDMAEYNSSKENRWNINMVRAIATFYIFVTISESFVSFNISLTFQKIVPGQQ